eukprot:5722935-Alexandrium_andersonii.AAC.1
MPVGSRSPQRVVASTPRSWRPACPGTGATSKVSCPCLGCHLRTVAWPRFDLSPAWPCIPGPSGPQRAGA